MGEWIATAAMQKFEFDNPEEFDYQIEAIATALSNINRYTGNTPLPYSVAQHCNLVCDYLLLSTGDHMIALQGLMHDAAEFATGDLSSPLKAWLKRHTQEFKYLELRIEEAMFKAFNIEFPMNELVKEADTRISLNEKNEFFANMEDKWQIEQQGVEPLPGVKIIPVPYFVARAEFLARFHFLTRAIHGQQ